MTFYSKPRRTPTVIIVSLIDIFAILLIFVIVTTTFKLPQPALVINLPESKSATAVAAAVTDPAVLTINSESALTLENKPVSLDDLGGALRTMLLATPGRPLALKADKDAPFGLVIKVLDALKESGVKNLPAFMEPQP